MGRTLLLPHTWGYHGLPGGCRSINIWIIWGIRAITRALFFRLAPQECPEPIGGPDANYDGLDDCIMPVVTTTATVQRVQRSWRDIMVTNERLL